jgi:hypothetical protein
MLGVSLLKKKQTSIMNISGKRHSIARVCVQNCLRFLIVIVLCAYRVKKFKVCQRNGDNNKRQFRNNLGRNSQEIRPDDGIEHQHTPVLYI